MKRCEVCNGYVGKPREVNLGDKVEFIITRSRGHSVSMNSRVGKLHHIKKNGFSVLYRGTLYHADEVSHPDDPSAISLAMFGTCSCEAKDGE